MSYVSLWGISRLCTGRMPWTLGFSLTGIATVVLALLALLNPTLQKAGILTLNVNIIPTQIPHLARGIPIVNIPPSIPGDVQTAVGGIPAVVSSGVGSVATAAQSTVTTVAQIADKLPRNVSLGTKMICMNFQDVSPDCRDVPFNITSTLPPGSSEIFGDNIHVLQSLESAIFGTLRDSLIAGTGLTLSFGLSFGLILRFWKPTSLWIRATTILFLGFSCLAVPFLLSVVAVTLFQSRVENLVSHNAFFSVVKGNVYKYCVGAFVSAICTLCVSVYMAFQP